MPISCLTDIERLEAERVDPPCVFDMLMAAARAHPDNAAFKYLESGAADAPVREMSYREFGAQLTQAANFFHDLGLSGTDVVSLVMPILPETYIAMFAAQRVATANPINYFLEPEQIAALLREAKARVVIAPDPDLFPGIWEKIEAILPTLPDLRTVIRVGGPPTRPDTRALHFESELATRSSDKLNVTRAIAPGDTASLFHTGGTTDMPKLVRHTQGGLALHSWVLAQLWPAASDDVYLNGMPTFHVGGANGLALMPLTRGATIVMTTSSGLRNKEVVANLWAHVARFKVTVVPMVPTSWGAAMSVPSDGHDLSSIRMCHSGGSPMPVELARAVTRKLGKPMVEGWGMTELHGYGVMNPAGGDCRIGSVGLRLPFLEVIVGEVDEGRLTRVLPAGEIGHVLVRGATLFGGYTEERFNRSTDIAPLAGETAPAWSVGGSWFDTGDLGRVDDDGYLWLTGRSKDLIIRGAHNIDPMIIEEALHKHPAIESAAAVGAPDAYAGELPVAFVQLKPGATASEGELQAFAREHVQERAAIPTKVTVLEQMPVTGVGKIFKPKLRALAAEAVFHAIAEAKVGHAGAVTVAVVPSKTHGTLAEITLSPDAPAETVAALKEALAGFSFAHEVKVADAS